jgi:hypothetical protein
LKINGLAETLGRFACCRSSRKRRFSARWHKSGTAGDWRCTCRIGASRIVAGNTLVTAIEPALASSRRPALHSGLLVVLAALLLVLAQWRPQAPPLK